MNITYFLDSVKKWGEKEEQIRAIILVGSYARGSQKEDSDVDLVIISTNRRLFWESNFVDGFGRVTKFQKEDWGRVTSLRVWYDNNCLEVEFGITTPVWLEKPLDEGTRRTLSDGFKVLLDKDAFFKDIDILL